MNESSAALFLILLLTSILSCSQQRMAPHSDTEIRIISYNIKFDDPSDSLNNWNERKDRVANLLNFYEPDFIGTQEGLLHQLAFLKNELEAMDYIGVGRTDGGSEGEFSAIFYATDAYELIAGTDSTIWLSESPSRPSTAWDAALPRILTWGKFRSKGDGREFFVFNTHFDHIGDTARAESANLIQRTINQVAGVTPAILTGDFNAQVKSQPYQNLTNGAYSLKDAFFISELPHIGPLFTYEGFHLGNSPEQKRIDYIFVNEMVMVKRHAYISEFRNGTYPSDHLPVVADIRLK